MTRAIGDQRLKIVYVYLTDRWFFDINIKVHCLCWLLRSGVSYTYHRMTLHWLVAVCIKYLICLKTLHTLKHNKDRLRYKSLSFCEECILELYNFVRTFKLSPHYGWNTHPDTQSTNPFRKRYKARLVYMRSLYKTSL